MGKVVAIGCLVLVVLAAGLLVVWGIGIYNGLVSSEEVGEILAVEGQRAALERVIERRLAFRSPISGRIHALSRLVHHLL